MTDTKAVLRRDVHIEIRPLAGRIGAELAGADAGADLNDEIVADIRHALLVHRVVF
jgi:alpha-ketoglutarate-dependent taurine dioxygenase